MSCADKVRAVAPSIVNVYMNERKFIGTPQEDGSFLVSEGSGLQNYVETMLTGGLVTISGPMISTKSLKQETTERIELICAKLELAEENEKTYRILDAFHRIA